MARDMDLIRRILLEMETLSKDGPSAQLHGLLYGVLIEDGYSEPKITHHLILLAEADFIEAEVIHVYGEASIVSPAKIKWPGYDFLEVIRDEEIYTKAKTTAMDKAGSLGFDIIKALAIQYARQAVGLG